MGTGNGPSGTADAHYKIVITICDESAMYSQNIMITIFCMTNITQQRRERHWAKNTEPEIRE